MNKPEEFKQKLDALLVEYKMSIYVEICFSENAELGFCDSTSKGYRLTNSKKPSFYYNGKNEVKDE